MWGGRRAGGTVWRHLCFCLCVQVQELDEQLAAGRRQLQQAQEELAAVRAAPDVVEEQLRGELEAVQEKISVMGEEVVLLSPLCCSILLCCICSDVWRSMGGSDWGAAM